MRRTSNRVAAPIGLTLAALAGSAPAARADLLTFDERPAGTYASTLYAPQGVTIQTASIPDAVTLGGLVTPTGVTDSFTIASFPLLSPTPPNILYHGTGLDYLLTFSAPVTDVGITTDTTGEPLPGEVVRLLALEPTGVAGQYRVVGLDEDVEGPPGVRLSVDIGRPFSFALIQVTNEPEGFDDLRFTPFRAGAQAVPEPAALLLFGGVVGLAAIARRYQTSCRSSRPMPPPAA